MKEAIKNYIIRKAQEIFSKKGFSNTTMDEIAEVSDISKPTLYKYFPSKENLFKQVLKVINDEVDNAILSSMDYDKSVFYNLRIITSKMLQFLIKHKTIMKIALFETRFFMKKEDKEHLKNMFENRNKRKKVLLKMLEKAKEKGEIREDVSLDIIILLYFGLTKEIGFEILFLDYKPEDIEELTDKILNIFINGIKRR